MNIEDIQAICATFPCVTEDIKWEHNLCFCVGGKMFLMLGLDHFPLPASFKVSPEDFEEMSTRPGFVPAPYLARASWVWTADISKLPPDEFKKLAREAYELVKAKLTKKVLRELGLE
jgi:predicted DNA-binding protein (MmcQ/YjbR family)